MCIITLSSPNFFFGHFVPLGILFLWAFCPFRNDVFWAFYPLGHFVVLGQNDFWAFCLWAFCHTWAFCRFGHFIIESNQSHKKKSILKGFISNKLFNYSFVITSLARYDEVFSSRQHQQLCQLCGTKSLKKPHDINNLPI